MNKAILRSALLLVSATLAFAACNIEPDSPGLKEDSGLTVTFRIGGDNTFTKSSFVGAGPSLTAGAIDLSEESGIEGLRLSEEISSLDEFYFNGVSTKATPVFTENLAQMYSELYVNAYTDGEEFDSWGKKDVKFTNEEGTDLWSHNYSEGASDSNLAWPEDGKLIFAIRTPDSPAYTYEYSENSVEGKDGYGYGTLSVSGYSTPASVADQKDILYSTKLMDESDGSCKVLLYHALTGVKFKIDDSKNKNGVKITGISKVEFNNIIYKGDFTIAPAYEGYSSSSNSDNAYPTSADVVTWYRDYDSVKSFSLNYDEDEQGVDLGGGKYDFPDAFKVDANKHNLNDADASKTFFFIPQEINGDVTLSVTYTYETEGGEGGEVTTNIAFGKAVTTDKDGKTISYEWLPGQLRTYTLKVGDDLSISLQDEVKGNVKSSLTITNTNTATCYIRVAVVGNWLTDADAKDYQGLPAPIAVTPCNQNDLLDVVDNNMREDFWVRVGNFYYYLYPLAGGKTITSGHTLFGNLDFSDVIKNKPYADCHLELSVAAQAILATEAANFWPEDAVKEFQPDTQD